MIQRHIQSHVVRLAQQFPVVAIMGPRQSGKTTLAKMTFPDYAYVTLEDLDKRLVAAQDPKGFLASFVDCKGVVIDEIQEVPSLLSYMQGVVDAHDRPGFFIITGSQHFLLHEKITQTLAGRIALLTLLPLSVAEMKDAGVLPKNVEELLLKGCYPRLYDRISDVRTWCASYINTYVERDVRQVLNINNLLAFTNVLKLCAARVGNLINYADIARDAGLNQQTIKEWISVLEASFIVKNVAPYYKNFSKRVTKSSKLYFYDTGLLCYLLGIRTADELFNHPLRGAIFESFVMSEMFKNTFNINEQPALYFWRDAVGFEIDCIIEKSIMQTVPVEIKASKTLSLDFFKSLEKWPSISQSSGAVAVVYGGDQTMQTSGGKAYAWHAVHEMMVDSLK